MKILIIMRGFFPGQKYGGPPVSVDNFCSLMSEYNCYVVTHNHDLFDNQPYNDIHKGWNDRGNCKALYLSDEKYNKATFEKIVLKIKPDVLYLQGVFDLCIVPCLMIAKKLGTRVLLAPRGELCAAAFNMKKYKKLPYIIILRLLGLVRNIHFQSTSEEETVAIKRILNCPIERIHRLDNIPSIPKKEYQRREKNPGIGRFIFLGRIHPKKNLLSAIKYFNAVNGEAIFDIYGSIEDEAYWHECQNAIKSLPKNVACEYKGLVSHDRVHEVFSQYDAFVFPTLSENYGHVIVEAITSGCFVILSKDTTPWNDLDHNGGFLIKLDQPEQWRESIQYVIDMGAEEYDSISKCLNAYTSQKLAIKRIQNEYNTVFMTCSK